MSEGHRRTGEQEKGPTGAEGLLGQDRRLDRLAGSRAPGIGLGCPLGLGGSGFCRRLGGCGVTSRLGYAAGDARLRGGGGGHRADPGTLWVSSGPKGIWRRSGRPLLGALMARVCPGAWLPGLGWAASGETPTAPGLETLTGREA